VKLAQAAFIRLLIGGIWLLPLLEAQQRSTGKWNVEGAMQSAREGARSVTLKGGRVMIVGGASDSGPVTSVDLFDAGGNAVPAAPMLSPHSQHIAVTLADGRVLVGDGFTAGGSLTNTAEIYDPVSNQWAPTGSMLVPRSGATASMLADGRVLVAGGDSSGVPTATLEIFDPASGQFQDVNSALSISTAPLS
jgi:N-acetylneuraminic acid mutarotase